MYTTEVNHFLTSGFLSSYYSKLSFSSWKKSQLSLDGTLLTPRKEHMLESTVMGEISVPRAPAESLGHALPCAALSSEPVDVRAWVYSHHRYGVQRDPQTRNPKSSTHSISLKFGIDRILSAEFDAKQKESSTCSAELTTTVKANHIGLMQRQTDQYYIGLNSGIYHSTSGMNSVCSAAREAIQHHFPGPYAVLSNDSVPQTDKRKRSWSRAVFSNLQRKGLEKRFEVQKYVTKPDRKQLAAMLGLTDAQVKVWFQNRRMKWRHSKKAQEHKRKRLRSKREEPQCAPKARESECESEGTESRLLDVQRDRR